MGCLLSSRGSSEDCDVSIPYTYHDAGIADGNIILKSYRQEYVVQGSKGKEEEKSTIARDATNGRTDEIVFDDIVLQHSPRHTTTTTTSHTFPSPDLLSPDLVYTPDPSSPVSADRSVSRGSPGFEEDRSGSLDLSLVPCAGSRAGDLDEYVADEVFLCRNSGSVSESEAVLRNDEVVGDDADESYENDAFDGGEIEVTEVVTNIITVHQV